jgi:hypothetical protein
MQPPHWSSNPLNYLRAFIPIGKQMPTSEPICRQGKHKGAMVSARGAFLGAARSAEYNFPLIVKQLNLKYHGQPSITFKPPCDGHCSHGVSQ